LVFRLLCGVKICGIAIISIKPKWCELIANGQKTVEVRKSRPKLETPFKVYIYCTKAKKYFFHGGIGEALYDLYRMPSGEIKFGYSGELMCCGKPYNKDNFLNGKVIGEFVCDYVSEFVYNNGGFLIKDDVPTTINATKQSCLTDTEFRKYAKEDNVYGWHISDLKIYDRPKELSEFGRYGNSIICLRVRCDKCVHLKYMRVNRDEYDYDCECNGLLDNFISLNRPPQSWRYVEEVREWQ